MKDKYIIIVVILIGVAFVLGMAVKKGGDLGGAAFTTDSQIASSTQFTLTTSSQRLLATSTRRVAASFSLYNCTASDVGVYLNFEQDALATVANADAVVFASTTGIFSVPTGNPITFESVTGITAADTCEVVVNEHRTR